MAHFPFTRCYLLLLLVLAVAIGALAERKEKVLYSFQGEPNDGFWPIGSVVFDKAGNLYGATMGWGPGSCTPIGNECGLVYELSPPAKKGDPWTETILHEFQGKESNDGSVPYSGLLIDNHGNLYGVTAYGGTGDCVLLGIEGGCGTVYELSPPTQKGGAWVEQVLYSFPTAKQGYVPNGDLVFDRAGNLYGATQFGGGKGNTCDSFYQYCGAVFKLSPPKNSGGTWTGSVLHSFAGGIDGANPNGGLVLDSKGVIYGTTVSGGNQSCKYQGEIGCGTAFKLIPPAKKSRRWTERELHVFTGGNDGGEPNAGLVLGAKGALFGIAEGGNGSGGGIVFRLAATKTGQWGETVLYWFSNTGFGAPLAGVILDSSGNLYGTTQGGGEDPHGTVFRLKPASRKTGAWTLKLLSEFAGSPDGAHPDSSLVLDNSGNLYGTTLWGGTGTTCQGGCGTVFEVSP